MVFSEKNKNREILFNKLSFIKDKNQKILIPKTNHT